MTDTRFTSTDAARTGNDLRGRYRELNAAEKQSVDEIRTIGEHLLAAIDRAQGEGNIREMSLARTNIEQGVMWAVKGMTK